MKRLFIHFIIFLVIGFLYLNIDNFYALERYDAIGLNAQGQFDIHDYFRKAVFIIEYLIAIFILYMTIQFKKKLSLPLIILFWIFLLVEFNFYSITGKAIAISDIANLNVAAGELDEAIKEFLPVIKQSLLTTSLLFLPLIALCFINFHKKINLAYFLMPIVILCSFYMIILVKRGEPALIGFPKGFSYGFGSLALKINDIIEKNTPLERAEVLKSSHSPFKKVVFIVDESINYQEFKNLKWENPYAIDYGRTLSSANCSASSNFVLRKAVFSRNDHVNKNQFLDIKNIKSFFQLAKEQNYTTAFIDNQNILNDLGIKNYFDKNEIEFIDLKLQEKSENHSRDLLSLKHISKSLNEKKVFIFANKVGAHFPYEETLELKHRTNDKIENYNKSIEINSLHYLDRLSELIDEDTIVFYTSDHGQDLKGRTTHCNTGSNVKETEYTVPFVVMTKNKIFLDDLRKNQPDFMNKLSHIEVSESTRNAMGFEVEEIASIFKSKTLLNPHFCGLYGPPKAIFGFMPRCFPLQ